MQRVILTEDIEGVASTLSSLCNALDGRRIFLTGGTGFFGKWLLHSFLRLRQLCGIDASLTVLSRDPKRFLDSYPEFSRQAGLDFVTGDIRTFTWPAGKTFDFVIHGATTASVKLEQEEPAEMYSVIVDGTRHMVDFAKQTGVSRFMLISSGAVYGSQPPELSHIPETYQGTPQNAYGKGKLLAEQLCVDAGIRHGFSALLPRCFAFVGPYLNLDIHFAIGNFIRDCLENRPIVIQGDGTSQRSYLYAADLAEWLWTILLRSESARPYNVGSQDAISIFDLAHRVRECAGTQNEIVVCGKQVEGSLPARYVPAVARAHAELALRQRHPLSEAIYRTIAWYRDPQASGTGRWKTNSSSV